MVGLFKLATAALCGALLFVAGVACAQDKPGPVGMRQIEFADGDRTLSLVVFYPATSEGTAKPFFMPFFTNINLLADATPSFDGTKRPLVMFSHGRGGNALGYAWFGQYLAGRGFIVASLNHYRANTYDSNIAYQSNRLWQRPVDIRLAISFLLKDPAWARMIDADRIGVAGHSQGGFTSLWLGGAKVSAEGYLAFQRGWRNNQMVPEHLRRELPLDPGPALDVRDPRIKAAFAMAPGIIKAFGMDQAGLRAMAIPSYVTVGARDTQTPPGPNAEFAAANMPNAELAILPGLVDHEIFTNECNAGGRDEFPEACIDAPTVDRAAIHQTVGQAAVRFFRATLGIPTPRQ